MLLLAIVSNPAHAGTEYILIFRFSRFPNSLMSFVGRATLARELTNFFGNAIAPAARQQIPQ